MYIALLPHGFITANSKVALCSLLMNVTITDNGTVIVDDFVDTISYNMTQYSKAEALQHFARSRMPTLLKAKGIKLHRLQDF